MCARMMQISKRLAGLAAQSDTLTRAGREALHYAERELFRGQCNCSYWHGAFGGIYLPHLRNTVFNHLIAADNLLYQVEGRDEAWVEATAADLNFDLRQEVQLANDELVALIAPAA